MKKYTSEAKSLVLLLPLPLTTQLYQMHEYFAVKGHNFGHFQQPNLNKYVQNTIFGRPITPKLTSEEYD